MIASPNANPRDDDKECQDALESEFLQLVERGVDAGWTKTQVIKSLNDLTSGLWFDEQRFSDASRLPAVGTFSVD